MAYQNDIPKATDKISQSQSDILGNFAAIQTLIDVDHVDFASANQGQHNKVTMPVQVAAPVFAAGSLGLYNLLNATTGVNELYFNNQAGVNYPLSSKVTATAAGVTGTSAFLPNGLLMKFGTSNVSGPGVVTIAIPTLIRAFAGTLFAIAIPIAGAGATYCTVVNGSVTATSFNVNVVGGVSGFYWLAIGT